MSTLPPSTIRILVSACGTGGHYYPALAIARCLLDAGAGVRILVDRPGGAAAAREFLGADAPILELRPERKGKWRRLQHALERYRATSRLLSSSAYQAFLSMGGGGSLPPLLAALRHGVPVALHEANAYPGRANRWCARRAARLAYAMRGPHPFYHLSHAVEVGMPLRGYSAASGPSVTFPTSSFSAPGDPRPRVLVVGGSQGAHLLNERVAEALRGRPELARSLRVAHLTGDADRDAIAEAYARAGTEVEVRAGVADLPRWLERFDYAISRAGASAVWELLRAGLPALLVPYPFAADDHQMANARWAAGIGPYEPIRQEALTPSLIADRLATVADRRLGRGAPGTGRVAPETERRSRTAAAQMADLLLGLASPRLAAPAGRGEGTGVAWGPSTVPTLTTVPSEP